MTTKPKSDRRKAIAMLKNMVDKMATYRCDVNEKTGVTSCFVCWQHGKDGCLFMKISDLYNEFKE